VVKDDPYELRFVFPRGTNYMVAKAVARRGFHKLPVEIFNHQGWAAVRFTSPKTTEIKWEIQFEPSDAYHFPPSEPAGLAVERAGLDGVNLSWREQYYLNSGYQVYLNDKLQGYTPIAQFPIRGLDPLSNYTARVKTVAEDGRESARSAQVKFSIESMVPSELSLTQLEPLHSTGRWRGFEIDEMLAGGAATIGDNHYEHALRAFVNSEAEFDLKGLYKKFSALAGLDGNSNESSTAEFIVLGDGKELWRSGSVTRSEPKPVEVDVTGIQKLTLRSTSDAGRRTRAQSVWANPVVKK
jgi:hypothetical protein